VERVNHTLTERVDGCCKEIAPSNSLRKWLSHDPKKWSEFKRRYIKELDKKDEEIEVLIRGIEYQTLTFLYGTKGEMYNNAAALKEYVGKRLKMNH